MLPKASQGRSRRQYALQRIFTSNKVKTLRPPNSLHHVVDTKFGAQVLPVRPDRMRRDDLFFGNRIVGLSAGPLCQHFPLTAREAGKNSRIVRRKLLLLAEPVQGFYGYFDVFGAAGLIFMVFHGVFLDWVSCWSLVADQLASGAIRCIGQDIFHGLSVLVGET